MCGNENRGHLAVENDVVDRFHARTAVGEFDIRRIRPASGALPPPSPHRVCGQVPITPRPRSSANDVEVHGNQRLVFVDQDFGLSARLDRGLDFGQQTVGPLGFSHRGLPPPLRVVNPSTFDSRNARACFAGRLWT